MAHLTRPPHYNIEDSNIALLGSDLEKRVREHAGDKEEAWESAGITLGLQIWRIEQFRVVDWPKEHYGQFYDGDSYIILYTYKKTPELKSFSYDLHFWLGQNTTQDEAGTAAYKTVELDDHLNGIPVQYREVQNYESPRFLSYFPQFISLHGGISTGFHHVTQLPPPDTKKLYRVTLSRTENGQSNLVVREVAAEAFSLIQGDVYILDKGTKILQLNTKKSAGQERYKAAEFSRNLADERKGQSEVLVYDEGGPGAGLFLSEFGEGTTLSVNITSSGQQDHNFSAALFQLSDKTGIVTFTPISTLGRESLLSEDVFLLDHSQDLVQPSIYVWVGSKASLNERGLALQYAQLYLYQKKKVVEGLRVEIPIIKLNEYHETDAFLRALET